MPPDRSTDSTSTRRRAAILEIRRKSVKQRSLTSLDEQDSEEEGSDREDVNQENTHEKGVGRSPTNETSPVALSEVTATHLERFELRKHNLGLIDSDGFDTIASAVLAALSNIHASMLRSHNARILGILQANALEASWRRNSLTLRKDLVSTITTASRKPEQWARDIIGHFIRILSPACLGGSHGPVQSHPEMVLASDERSSNKEWEEVSKLGRQRQWDPSEEEFARKVLTCPGKIVKGQKVQLEVTGSVDWVLFNFPEGKEKPDLEKGMTYSQAVAQLGLAQPERIGPRINILLIEAKRYNESARRRNLERHLPQVLAQVHVSMRKAGRTSLGWVLSTGAVWIFGVSNIKQGPIEQWRYAYFTTPRMIGPKNPVDESDVDAIMERAKVKLRILTFWCFADPCFLWRGMSEHERFVHTS